MLASPIDRFLAFLLDVIIFTFFVGIPLIYPQYLQTKSLEEINADLNGLVFSILFYIYNVIFELDGQTPGKKIMKIRVRARNKLSIFLRNITKMVWPILLIDSLWILKYGERYSDILFGSEVIKDEKTFDFSNNGFVYRIFNW